MSSTRASRTFSARRRGDSARCGSCKTADAAERRSSFASCPAASRPSAARTGADFIVDAALVSRLHCRLTAGATELEVVDLESTNGTFVNGERTDARDPEDTATASASAASTLVDLVADD